MTSETLSARATLQITVLGLLASAAAAFLATLSVHFLWNRAGRVRGVARYPADASSAGQTSDEPWPPVQPAVGTEMPADVPRHFTEDIVVPGFTETGQDVERQDDTEGRSPEGV